MIVDKYTSININLNQEERNVLRQATIILRKINETIEESDDADEARLSDVIDRKIISDIEDEISNLQCTVEL